MLRILSLIAVVLVVAFIGFNLIDNSREAEVSASAVILDTRADSSGFARALDPYDWQFPRDFGAHPDFQTEWWYYTGNLQTADGRHFGFQFTIFRRAIDADAQISDSEWRTNQLYMAHFAISDVGGGRFLHEERYSRGGAGLAGAQVEPVYRVWLEDWAITGVNDDATLTRIQARAADFAVDFTLDQLKAPALQGVNGLSAKSAEPGNASYYYTLSRLAADGTITIDDETFTVTGYAWKDHEFSTSALGDDALGWDWFGLQFDDGRELMIGQIRLIDGGSDPYFGGLLINADGSTVYLPAASFTLTPLDTWASPHSGALYPAAWDVDIDLPSVGAGAEPLRFNVRTLLADQELHGGGVTYYEGAVALTGDVTGFGYMELTGYADSMTGRF